MSARPLFQIMWAAVWLAYTGFGIGKHEDVFVFAIHVLVTIPLWVLILWVLILRARKGDL